MMFHHFHVFSNPWKRKQLAHVIVEFVRRFYEFMKLLISDETFRCRKVVPAGSPMA